MSFCTEIKNELSVLKTRSCCMDALIYGFALFGRSFNAKRIAIQTENEAVANLYKRLIYSVYGANVTIKRGGVKTPTFVCEVSDESDRLRVLASVDFGIFDGSINDEVFYKNCCISAFVRGAFLSCGHLSDPDNCYRADFYIKSEALAMAFREILSEHQIESNLSKRANGFVVYIKRNEMIVNLLAFMGASNKSLEFIEASVIKSLKNKTNRARNCDNANINRTVEASLRQRKAIEYLRKKGRLETLPAELISAAMLRLENPELSLKQLAAKSPEPITDSGLNHRLKKLMEIYEDIKK